MSVRQSYHCYLLLGTIVMFFICTLYDSTFIGTFGVQTFKVTTDYLLISSYLMA